MYHNSFYLVTFKILKGWGDEQKCHPWGCSFIKSFSWSVSKYLWNPRYSCVWNTAVHRDTVLSWRVLAIYWGAVPHCCMCGLF